MISRNTLINIFGIVICFALLGVFLYYFGFSKTEYQKFTVKRILNTVSIEKNDKKIFSTHPLWHVASYSLGDADKNGSTDIAMIIWKLEIVDVSDPLQKKADKNPEYKIKFGSHVAIYNLEPEFNLLWVSDVMPEPFVKIEILDEPQEKLFKIREARNMLDRFAIFSHNDSVWSWENWQFKKIQN